MPDNHGRAIGIDLGDARVGVALSNPDRTLASPIEVIKRTGNLYRDIAKIVEEWEANVVVVGLPLSLDGSVGPAAKKALKEVEKLGATLGVPVETYDERLTTVTAERMMTDLGLDSREQRKVVDKIAAAIMLQAWLDRQAHLHLEAAAHEGDSQSEAPPTDGPHFDSDLAPPHQ